MVSELMRRLVTAENSERIILLLQILHSHCAFRRNKNDLQ